MNCNFHERQQSTIQQSINIKSQSLRVNHRTAHQSAIRITILSIFVTESIQQSINIKKLKLPRTATKITILPIFTRTYPTLKASTWIIEQRINQQLTKNRNIPNLRKNSNVQLTLKWMWIMKRTHTHTHSTAQNPSNQFSPYKEHYHHFDCPPPEVQPPEIVDHWQNGGVSAGFFSSRWGRGLRLVANWSRRRRGRWW